MTAVAQGRAALALLVLAACGRGNGVDESGPPRMRPAELGGASAVYFTLRNPSPDTLILLGAEIDVAAATGIHQSMEHDGMASMHPVDSVVVLPRDSVRFAARGLHVMASGVHAALVVGDTVVMRLRYRGTRMDTVRVAVRE